MAESLTLVEILVGPWLILTIGGLSAFTVYWLIRGRWTRAAARLGMKYVWEDVMPSLIDECDGFRIRIGGRVSSRDTNCRYEVRIDGRGKIPSELRLTAKTRLLPVVMSAATATGDSYFDDQIHVVCSVVMATALLDQAARKLIIDEVARKGVEVSEGRVFLGLSRLAPKAAAETIERGLQLARHLQRQEGELIEALARNATQDSSPAVRLRNLKLMLEHYSDEEITRLTCQQLVDTEPSHLSLEAGIFLGDEGLDTVCKIADSQDVHDDLRVHAVEYLAGVRDNEHVPKLLERLLDTDSEPLRLAAINSLAQLGHRPVLARMQAMTATADRRTLVALIKALAAVGGPESEPKLVELLSGKDTQVRMAAIRALAEVGTAIAVEPLQELTGSIVPVLRRTSHQAIAAIQSRLVGADKGQVSLAVLEEEEGQLSIAGPEGALSAAQDS